MEQLAPADSLATHAKKRTALEEMSNGLIHTRTCNKRTPCSCLLRYESNKFHENLIKKKARTGVATRTRGRVVVKRLGRFELNIKSLFVKWLTTVDIAALSMASHQWRKDVDIIVERNSIEFVSDEMHKHKVYKAGKSKAQTWSRYLHMQMNCVHKLFVYYTAYKTGAMRRSTPQWAFGEVHLDPNDPTRSILPNSWSFQGHSPWLKHKRNGKGGEWKLTAPYHHGKAPRDFLRKVTDWVGTIRPGSLLAVSFKHDDASEVTWWEAQVWYVWRAEGREEDAIVYDAQHNEELTIRPQHLLEHFQTHPEHVVDVCTTPRSICRVCEKKELTFYDCHVVRGHPML